MARRIIPQKTTYICDRCGKEQEGSFRLSGTLTLRHGLQDFQGAVVAGYNRTWELCDACLSQARTDLATNGFKV